MSGTIRTGDRRMAQRARSGVTASIAEPRASYAAGSTSLKVGATQATVPSGSMTITARLPETPVGHVSPPNAAYAEPSGSLPKRKGKSSSRAHSKSSVGESLLIAISVTPSPSWKRLAY